MARGADGKEKRRRCHRDRGSATALVRTGRLPRSDSRIHHEESPVNAWRRPLAHRSDAPDGRRSASAVEKRRAPLLFERTRAAGLFDACARSVSTAQCTRSADGLRDCLAAVVASVAVREGQHSTIDVPAAPDQQRGRACSQGACSQGQSSSALAAWVAPLCGGKARRAAGDVSGGVRDRSPLPAAESLSRSFTRRMLSRLVELLGRGSTWHTQRYELLHETGTRASATGHS